MFSVGHKDVYVVLDVTEGVGDVISGAFIMMGVC